MEAWSGRPGQSARTGAGNCPGPPDSSAHVDVRQLLDGSWRVHLDDRLIATAAPTAHRDLRARRRRKHGRGAPAGVPVATQLIEAAL